MFKSFKNKMGKTKRYLKMNQLLRKWEAVNINPSPGQLWGEFAAVMEIVKTGLTKIRMSQWRTSDGRVGVLACVTA